MRRKKKQTTRQTIRRFIVEVIGLQRLGPIGTALLVAAPVTAAALFYVWTHVQSVKLGYALSKAGQAHERLLEQNRAGKLDVAALEAPERLERMAKKYGLKAPRVEQVIRVDDPVDVAPPENGARP